MLQWFYSPVWMNLEFGKFSFANFWARPVSSVRAYEEAFFASPIVPHKVL